MTLSPAPLLVSALSIHCAASLLIQEESHEHAHHTGPPVNYGHVHLPIGCNEGAQEAFDRADAMLHSFEYEEAEKTFAESGTRDPACAMSYWGIAMTHWHPIWEPPGAADLKKGLEASGRATALVGKSDREREYIAAISAFFKG